MDRTKKIILIGLDSAGKTSILRFLNQKYNLLDDIKPTTGIDREIIKILGIPVMAWDFGGQEKYRNEYLNDIRLFGATDSLFFVVDMHDPARFELALQYYISVLIIFESLGINPKVILCLHKIDPNIRNDPKTQELIGKAKDLFLTNSRSFEITVFNTSIYDAKSIMRAFSDTLQQLLTIIQPFKQILESIVVQLKLEGAILFDENLMILGEFYSNKVCEELCLNLVYNSVYQMRINEQQLEDEHFSKNFEYILNLKNKEERFKFLDIKFRDWNLYLLTIGTEKSDANTMNTIFTIFNSLVHIFDDQIEKST